MIWEAPWRSKKTSPDVYTNQSASPERFLPFTPILAAGAVIGLASACAISTANNAATEVSQISQDVASFVDLLPNSDNTPCETCGETPPASPVTPEPPREVQPKRKVSPPPSPPIEGSVQRAGAVSIGASLTQFDLLTAPRCEGIAAYIITVFDKSKHSVASLSSDPMRQAVRRREGQMFGEYRVAKIGLNRRKMSSAVWLESDAGICQVLLRDDHPKRERLIDAAMRSRERQEQIAQRKARIQKRKIEQRRAKIEQDKARIARQKAELMQRKARIAQNKARIERRKAQDARRNAQDARRKARKKQRRQKRKR